jgi:hypothetical protein
VSLRRLLVEPQLRPCFNVNSATCVHHTGPSSGTNGDSRKLLLVFYSPRGLFVLKVQYLNQFWCLFDGLWTGRTGFDSRQRKDFFLYSIESRPALGPTQPLIQWVAGAVSVEVKRLGREADHSPLSSTAVKNCGAIPPLFMA